MPTTTAAPTTTATTRSTMAPTTTTARTTSTPSTCTPTGWTSTVSYTSTSSCPTPYEVGTYCGFVNPEDPCAAQPGGKNPVHMPTPEMLIKNTGSGPHVTPDTAAAFKAYGPFQDDALNAVTPTSYVETFKDLNAAVNANSYLGYKTLKNYDINECASFCDNTKLCIAFNIYIERDPSINPNHCSCTNPASITTYKCSLWGSKIDASSATNHGQNRGAFEVVIVASNGYDKTGSKPPTPPGCTKPTDCDGSIHNHPDTCIGQHFFPGPFDVGVCASYAQAVNANGKNTGPRCSFFNAFSLTEDGVPKGTYCNLFSQQYPPSSASYKPGWSNGETWGVGSSWGFSL